MEKHIERAAGLLLPPELLEHVAALIAEHVAERLGANAEPWLDVPAAAKHLCVPESTVYSLASTGAIPAHRLGSKLLRFRRAELDDYLQEAR